MPPAAADSRRRRPFVRDFPRFPAPNDVYSRRVRKPFDETNMPDEEWIKTLGGGRKVKFVYQQLPGNGAFLTAQIEGNEVVYSILLATASNPLSREDVEGRFNRELSKK